MKHKQKSSMDQATLFAEPQEYSKEDFSNRPLSIRMRPRSLEDYVGQQHLLAEGKLLRRAIKADRLSSLILYGPPGCGKTTLAQCISFNTKAMFHAINAVNSNVDDLRKIIAIGRHRKINSQQKTILFIDEIHRFNKAQQDVLMPDLEEGHLILIGATVLNPFFSLIGPLLSRSMIVELQALSSDDLKEILQKALKDKERGLGSIQIDASLEAIEFLANISDGDARKALNALELGCLTTPPDSAGNILFDLRVAEESIQKKKVQYDRDGDEHYDTISAFIKSMRGSDPDAAIYWLAKMLHAGEDPRFIARRMCICAAEDVGNADPRALLVSTAAFQALEFIGMPEARIPLAQAAIYIACAPKSNASYLAIDQALEDVKSKKTQKVPNDLKDTSYQGAKKLNRGEGYKYAHSYPGHFVEQEYMPDHAIYYNPFGLGFEKELKERLIQFRAANQKFKKSSD